MTWRPLAELMVKSKYLLAATTYQDGSGCVHMLADPVDIAVLTAMAPFDDAATQPQVDARLNAAKASFLDHCEGVGTIYVDGEHLGVDTYNLAAIAAVPDATDLASAITLINAFKLAIVDHGWGDTEDGHHFHDDVTTGGRYFALTVDPPVTLDDCWADTNDIVAGLLVHYRQASV